MFTSIVGSTLHGTTTPKSDVDMRNVYRVSLRERLSPFFNERSKKVKRDEHHDDVSYELSHFASLLSKNNPTAMEVAFSNLIHGDSDFAHRLGMAALDTEQYFKQTNGMIIGMYMKGTVKSLHHAKRLEEHLRIYRDTGVLIFDARKYRNYKYLMAVKNGSIMIEPMSEKITMRHKWHTQSLDTLESIVYNEYVADRDRDIKGV